jgi:hypothetical protein
MEFLCKLQEMGKVDSDAPLEEGVIGSENKGAMWGNSENKLSEDSLHFLNVVNSPLVLSFFTKLLGGPVLTYNFKWPRANAKGGNMLIRFTAF